MKLSVVIVNYNVKYFLEQCLLSITESRLNFEIEIFVIDNNSSDNSLDYLSPKFPTVRFIASDKNVGFAKANNRVIRICTGDYILLLNPDTLLGENTLAQICSFMDTTNNAGAVGLKMIDGGGQFAPESKRGFPSTWASFCKTFGFSKIFPKSGLFGGYHLTHLSENETHEVEVLSGACMLVRKKILDKIGLLDEDFFMHCEDIDLSYRIREAGYKNYYLPFTILHYKGESSIANTELTTIIYDAMHIFLKKYYTRNGRFYLKFAHLGIRLQTYFARLKHFIGKKKKPTKIVLLDHGKLSYEEMIKQMSESSVKRVDYQIYSPKSGMVIGSHFAQQKIG